MIDVKVVTIDDIDNRTIILNADNKLQAQQPPIVHDVPYSAAGQSVTVPTGATNAVLFLVGSDSGQLRNIIGGVQGQIIYLRYKVGVTLVNSSSIRLINAAAPNTALDSNKVSTFLCLAPSVWTEISRNFS